MSKDQKNNKKENCGNCGNCGFSEKKMLEINLMSTLENHKIVAKALEDSAFVASIAKLITSECPDSVKINLAVVSLSHIKDK